MKKVLSIIAISLSFILILDSMNAGYALTMFLLAGIVPGTNIVVSADQMLNLCALLIGFIVARLSVQALQALLTYRETAKQAAKTRA